MSSPTPAPIPTQSKHPWRTAVRTAFQVAVALATLLPYVIADLHVEAKAGVAQVLAVSVAITRIMAMPAVNEFLRKYVPWLAADKPDPEETSL